MGLLGSGSSGGGTLGTGGLLPFPTRTSGDRLTINASGSLLTGGLSAAAWNLKTSFRVYPGFLFAPGQSFTDAEAVAAFDAITPQEWEERARDVARQPKLTPGQKLKASLIQLAYTDEAGQSGQGIGRGAPVDRLAEINAISDAEWERRAEVYAEQQRELAKRRVTRLEEATERFAPGDRYSSVLGAVQSADRLFKLGGALSGFRVTSKGTDDSALRSIREALRSEAARTKGVGPTAEAVEWKAIRLPRQKLAADPVAPASPIRPSAPAPQRPALPGAPLPTAAITGTLTPAARPPTSSPPPPPAQSTLLRLPPLSPSSSPVPRILGAGSGPPPPPASASGRGAAVLAEIRRPRAGAPLQARMPGGTLGAGFGLLGLGGGVLGGGFGTLGAGFGLLGRGGGLMGGQRVIDVYATWLPTIDPGATLTGVKLRPQGHRERERQRRTLPPAPVAPPPPAAPLSQQKATFLRLDPETGRPVVLADGKELFTTFTIGSTAVAPGQNVLVTTINGQVVMETPEQAKKRMEKGPVSQEPGQKDRLPAPLAAVPWMQAGMRVNLGTCTLATTEYLYNSDGSTYATPIRGITRRAMRLSVGTSGNAAATVQINVYDYPHFNPGRGIEGQWTVDTGNPYGTDGFLGGPEASGTHDVRYQSNSVQGSITYLALPIGSQSCILCVGTRYLTFDESSLFRFSYDNGPLYPVAGGEQYDRNEAYTLESYVNTGTQNYAYYAWVVTPSSITATSMPAGVEATLKAELGDGILTRNFVGYDSTTTVGSNMSPRTIDTRSGWTSTSTFTSGVYIPGSTAAFRESWNWAGSTQYPIFLSQYAGLTNLGVFADEYPSAGSLVCQGFGPGTTTAVAQGDSARLWLIGADRTPDLIVSQYLFGAPVPDRSPVIDYSASEGTDATVTWQPLERLDYKIANVTGGELGAPVVEAVNPAPNWSDMPDSYSILNDQRRRLVYWDWGRPTYCRDQATALGFTLP